MEKRKYAKIALLNPPSMSRRGKCYDNAMAENFFSILKTERIYRSKPNTPAEAYEMIDRFLYFYNHGHRKFHIPTLGQAFLCCPHKMELFTAYCSTGKVLV